MDTSEKKLVVFLDALFFIDYYIKRKELKDQDDDLLLSNIINFSNLIFNSTENEIVSVVSEKRISPEDFNRAKATLASSKDLSNFRKKYESRIISGSPIRDSQRAIFLVQESDQFIKDHQKNSWILHWNMKNAFSEFSKLSIDSIYHKVIGIIPGSDIKKSTFDFSTLSDFRIITNEITIIDPFISTWDEIKINENLVPFLKYLFLGNEVPNYRIKLKIITMNDFDRAENTKNEDLKTFITKLENIICKELSSFKIDYFIICVDRFKIKKDSKEKKKYYVPFFKFVRSYFHDRNYISNFLYCKSGNSLDFNKNNPHTSESVVTNDTDLTLFSLLINSNCLRVVEHAKKLMEFDKHIKNKENLDYFDSTQGSIN